MPVTEIEIDLLKKNCIQQSKAIAKELTHAGARETQLGAGVLAGLSGEALFLFYYSQWCGEQQYYDLGCDLLQQAVDTMRLGRMEHTHCSGLAGLGWTVMHLQKNDLLDIEVNELLDDIDGYLAKKLMHDITHSNYDFLHGALGVALYFLKRTHYTPAALHVLQDFVSALEKLAIRVDKTLKWESLLNSSGERGYNISLSHGMASLVVVLSKLYVANIEKDRVEQMLKGAVNYILQQQLDYRYYSSCFPAYSLESSKDISSSRLAWCYGDLGIASSLWIAGKTLQSKPWKVKSIEIFLRATNRTNVSEAGVIDAGLCHGSVGIAHLFNRAHQYTNIPAFETARDYWLQQTMQMATFEDGLAGYKTYRGKNSGYQNETNLLEGVAGIGLAYMAALQPSYMKWDECLLLS